MARKSDWRRLDKRLIIHLLESMHSDKEIIESVKKNRSGQKSLDNTREACWDCKAIAEELGIE